jgi:hypothetical protein
MSNLSKNMVYVAAGVSVLVAVAAVADIVIGIPFSFGSEERRMFFDISLLIGAAGALYLCWETWRDMK